MKSLVVTILSFLFVFTANSAFAQRDSSMDDLLEQVGQEAEKVDKSPVESSTVSGVNMKVHWKLWKRVYSAGKSGSDELEALRHDGWSVGWVNQPEYAMAVGALAPALEDSEEARAAFDGAEELAPQVPYPAWLHAAWALRSDFGNVGGWAAPWVRGVKAAVKWPDTVFGWSLKFAVYLLLAFAAASFVFVLGQLTRNFGIAAYDFARVMPRGFSSNQTAVLLVALVVVPGLLLRSPLVSVLITLAIVTFVQRPNERVVSILVFGLIASLTYVDDGLSRIASYPDSITQRMTHAQWIHCATGCQEEMDELARRYPADAHIRYSALLAAYREGGEANMRRVVEEVPSVEWPGEIIGFAHNLQGAAHIALAQPKEAIEILNQAREELRETPAPSFNLMRAHQMLDDKDAASAALEEASSRSLERVTWFLTLERRDTNSFVIAQSLPLESLLRYHVENAEYAETLSPVEPFWRLIAGDAISFEQTRLVGLAGIALVLLGFPLRRRTSTPCPRCGLARDPTDDSRTARHAYCFPCYSTFVTGATLDYDARVHNEKVLGRRESLQRTLRRFSGLLIPGLGHQVAGHAGTGFAITATIVFSAALILRPMGIVRVAQELVATNWTGHVTLAWIAGSICVFILLNTALRGLPPVGARGVD